MAEHVWSVLCTTSVTDSKTGYISLINVIEEVTIPATPDGFTRLLPMPMQFITLWKRSSLEEDEKLETRILFILPNKERLDPPDNLKEMLIKGRAISITRMQNLPISMPGYHYFVLQKRLPPGEEWQEVTCVPIEIKFVG